MKQNLCELNSENGVKKKLFGHWITMISTNNESVKVEIRQRSAGNTPEDVVIHDSSDENEDDLDREKKLLKKLDWRIVPWVFCLYFLSVEDRSNVGYAMTMNKDEGHTLMDTAGLTAQQNNIGLGLFYVAYIVSFNENA